VFDSQRDQKILIFSIVGLTTLLVDIVIFNLLLNIDINPEWANFISTSIAAIYGYVGHLKFTFKANDVSGNFENFSKFILLGILSIAVGQIILVSLIDFIDGPDRFQINLIKVFSILFVAIIRFLIMNTFIFVNKKETQSKVRD
jgi:putative flippase GtrA